MGQGQVSGIQIDVRQLIRLKQTCQEVSAPFRSWSRILLPSFLESPVIGQCGTWLRSGDAPSYAGAREAGLSRVSIGVRSEVDLSRPSERAYGVLRAGIGVRAVTFRMGRS